MHIMEMHMHASSALRALSTAVPCALADWPALTWRACAGLLWRHPAAGGQPADQLRALHGPLAREARQARRAAVRGQGESQSWIPGTLQDVSMRSGVLEQGCIRRPVHAVLSCPPPAVQVALVEIPVEGYASKLDEARFDRKDEECAALPQNPENPPPCCLP